MKKFLSKMLIINLCFGVVLPSIVLSGGTKAMAAQQPDVLPTEIDDSSTADSKDNVIRSDEPDGSYSEFDLNEFVKVKSFDTSGRTGSIYQVLAKVRAYADGDNYKDDTLKIAVEDKDNKVLKDTDSIGVLDKGISNVSVRTVDISDVYADWTWKKISEIQVKTTFVQFDSIDDAAVKIFVDMISLIVRTDDSNPTVNVFKPEAGNVYKGGDTATIMWSASDVDTWVKYGGITLDYSADSGATWNHIANGVVNNPQQRDWVTPKITSNQVKVRVTAEDGTNHKSSAISETFSINSTVSAPTNLVVKAGDKKVDLNWDSVAGAKLYNVYYRKNSEINYTGPVNVLTNQASVINLENGVNYFFIIRAIGNDGNESLDAGSWAMPIGPKVVLASSAKKVVATGSTIPSSVSSDNSSAGNESAVETPSDTTEQGQIKSADDEDTTATEDINWTPWIILFILIVLAGAATGGYFYWFGKDEEDEIITKEVIKKNDDSAKNKATKKPESNKKSRRW